MEGKRSIRPGYGPPGSNGSWVTPRNEETGPNTGRLGALKTLWAEAPGHLGQMVVWVGAAWASTGASVSGLMCPEIVSLFPHT